MLHSGASRPKIQAMPVTQPKAKSTHWMLQQPPLLCLLARLGCPAVMQRDVNATVCIERCIVYIGRRLKVHLLQTLLGVLAAVMLSKTKLIQPGRKQAQYIFFACAQHSPVGLTCMAGCAGRRTNKRKILCTCRVVPGCIAGHRLGLVGPSGVGSRSIVALGSTILRALLVLRGVLGPYSNQGHVNRVSGGNT